jgi:hypothetical protein
MLRRPGSSGKSKADEMQAASIQDLTPQMTGPAK